MFGRLPTRQIWLIDSPSSVSLFCLVVVLGLSRNRFLALTYLESRQTDWQKRDSGTKINLQLVIFSICDSVLCISQQSCTVSSPVFRFISYFKRKFILPAV